MLILLQIPLPPVVFRNLELYFIVYSDEFIFFRVATKVLTWLLPPWATCLSELMGFCLLHPLIITHIATFFSISLGVSLVLFPYPQFFYIPFCGLLFSSTKKFARATRVSSFFCRCIEWQRFFALSLRLWLGAVLDCFVVGVENLLFGDDGLWCSYLGPLNDDYVSKEYSSSPYHSISACCGVAVGWMDNLTL